MPPLPHGSYATAIAHVQRTFCAQYILQDLLKPQYRTGVSDSADYACVLCT